MFVTVVGLLLVREWGSSRGDEDGEAPAARKLRQALWAMAGAYLALILLTVCLFDAYTPLDNRILLPLRAILVVLVAGAVFRPPPWASAEMNGKRGPPVMSGDFRRAGRLPYGNLPLRPAVLLGPLLIALAVAQVVTLARWTAEARDKHLGFNSTVWQRSPTLLALAALPRRSIIYTNAFEAAYLLHGRPCKEVPALRDPNTGRPLTAAYAERLGRIRDDLRANDGYVVYARRLRRPMLASEEQLVRDLPLERVSETRDGAVYRLRSGS
jgi:hypothetical protein